MTYELRLPDGRILRTRISHPPDRTSYGRNLWAHILRDQLNVSEEEFWRCVREGESPDRGIPAAPAETLPADLVHLLIARVGLTEAEIMKMTREEAIARLHTFWADGT
ncbi:cytotoxic translational repressor of toxin-antitoxin stability system [Streptosporangium sp. NPDC048047]|uniref:cytotoxic translational repressor of toxin-antitoxin stability system n=1 Tax=unclassified Streptosporangium TaxID=2632669 RepID=UPI003429F3C8